MSAHRINSIREEYGCSLQEAKRIFEDEAISEEIDLKINHIESKLKSSGDLDLRYILSDMLEIIKRVKRQGD